MLTSEEHALSARENSDNRDMLTLDNQCL